MHDDDDDGSSIFEDRAKASLGLDVGGGFHFLETVKEESGGRQTEARERRFETGEKFPPMRKRAKKEF